MAEVTGAEIRAARETLGLTQSQIAPLLGYGAAPRVAEIESGRRNASECVIRLIQAYLAGYRPPDWPGA